MSPSDFTTEIGILSSLAVACLPKNNRLGPYLAGLIEGDGSIYVPVNPRSPSGSLNVGGFEICFDLRDYPLADYIRSMIGGYIQIRGQACILHIRRIKSVLEVITLINGHMRTPKIEALHRLIIWYNNQHGTQIPLLGLEETPLQTNSWLAGILDCDAGFYFNWSTNNKGIPSTLQYYLRLSQRRVYHRDSFVGKSYEFIMTKIANFFSAPLIFIDRKRKAGYTELAYGVRTGSYLANYIALSYLNQYPLFSYKYSKVPVQLELLRLQKNKLHKSKEGLLYLISLKDLMNSYSASSHWEHIQNNFPKN